MTHSVGLVDLAHFVTGVGFALSGTGLAINTAIGVVAPDQRSLSFPVLLFGEFWPWAVPFILMGLGLAITGVGVAGTAYHRPVAEEGPT